MNPRPPNPTPPPLPRRRFLGRLLAAAAGLALARRAGPVEAAVEEVTPYLGEIILFAGNFAPKGWAFCNGQVLAINTNTALYNVLGTAYGGNGSTTFALPDLRGRVPIHQGQGPGLSARTRGSVGGEIGHTLTIAEIPSHTHVARGASAPATAVAPAASLVPARNPAQIPQWGAGADVVMGTDAISSAGGGQPHFNDQPYLVVNFIIALTGMFPSP